MPPKAQMSMAAFNNHPVTMKRRVWVMAISLLNFNAKIIELQE
jgi:hypothetical protein